MKRVKESSFWLGNRYFCARCHKQVGYIDSFCGYCGETVEWEECPGCRHISESMKGDFCRDCGARLVEKELNL